MVNGCSINFVGLQPNFVVKFALAGGPEPKRLLGVREQKWRVLGEKPVTDREPAD